MRTHQAEIMSKIEIKIPDIAENVESGLVARILVSEGDSVSENQPLVEIETDKATTDIPSTGEGTVEEIRVSEGDEVKVGQVIMVLEGESKEQEEKGKEEEEKEKGKEEKEKGEEKEVKGKEEEEKSKEEKTEKARDGVVATPLVRRIAREEDIDLEQVEGSGPRGRITREDLESYMDKPSEGKKEAKLPADEIKRREKLPNIRKITGQRMSESWQNIPHVTQFDESDITGLEAYRNKMKPVIEKQGGKLTLTALLVKVSAYALMRFPRFASQLDDDRGELTYQDHMNICVAVDTDRGLLVPVVRDADRKSLAEVSAELTVLSEKARDGKISMDELQGGVFTISNLGGIGGTGFTPIVYAPQVAILGVSRGQYKQIYREDTFQKRLVLPLSLSYDHRVIDGAEGARFLRWICEALEEPFGILL